METPSAAATPTASSSNYYAIAQKDDQAAIEQELQRVQPQNGESSTTGRGRTSLPTTHDGHDYEAEAEAEAGGSSTKEDKAEIRRQRIAAAVERSKSEYKSEHAFTERWWYEDESIDRNVLSKPKADRQHLEYLTTGLYYANPPDYQTALDLIIRAYDSGPSSKKTLGGLTRELIDIGIRSAVALADVEAGVRLVEGSKSLWKGQNAGHSALSAEVYLKAGRPKDALTPLLISLSSFGLHAPNLSLLSQALNALIASPYAGDIDQDETSTTSQTTTVASSRDTDTISSDYKATKELISIVDRAAAWKGSFLQTPLFRDERSIPAGSITDVDRDSNGDSESKASNQPQAQTQVDMIIAEPIDVGQIVIELALDADQRKYLEGTWSRLSKGFKGDEGFVERSVREL
ncbi:hypothetical protein IAU59_001341 [Kwoniella sp. CBS 9459]